MTTVLQDKTPGSKATSIILNWKKKLLKMKEEVSVQSHGVLEALSRFVNVFHCQLGNRLTIMPLEHAALVGC